MRSAALWGFPNPVNEKAARLVAGGVLLETLATLTLSLVVAAPWAGLSGLLALGFLSRVASGPRLNPLGRLATQVLAPRLGAAVLVPGPPKRFAQAIGLVVTTTAALAAALGAYGLAQIVLVLIVAAAALESLAGYCIGCRIFRVLMRLGLIPPETCVACNDVATMRTATIPAGS